MVKEANEARAREIVREENRDPGVLEGVFATGFTAKLNVRAHRQGRGPSCLIV